jgi:NAD(P)-dependent dehydrogenase (short-subunit alcohol dehydrogenase family)
VAHDKGENVMTTSWSEKTWFITGASAGFGRAIAKEVLHRGGRVIATARNIDALDDLVSLSEGRAVAVRLDVTNVQEIASAFAVAQDFGGFDVLLNNAGYGFLGGVEESSDSEIEQQLDVNFFAPLRLMRAALPALRERGSGYIVNMSSIGGTCGLAGAAFYAASKFGLEGLSESLAGEIESFGLRVLIVEPGYFRTQFSGRSIRLTATPNGAYPQLASQREWVTSVDGKQMGDPARAASAIIRAMDSDSPPLRLLLGSDAYAFAVEALQSRRAEVETWRELSESTDFPPGQ